MPHGEPPRSAAARRVFERYDAPEVIAALDDAPLTIFSGWPGLMYLHDHLAAQGHPPPPLHALRERALRHIQGRGDLPQDTTWLFGARGATFALSGGEARSWAPPPQDRGPDSYGSDAPVLFDLLRALRVRSPGEAAALAAHLPAWSQQAARHLRSLEAAIQGAASFPLGFAHGAAGVLYRALLLRACGAVELDRGRIEGALDWLLSQSVEVRSGRRWPFTRGGPIDEDAPLSTSLCNGNLGHALVLLEAWRLIRREDLLAAGLSALRASAPEEALSVGFCCGHAGKIAVVGRFLREGLGAELGDHAQSWAHLPEREGDLAHTQQLSGVAGLASCLPALLARGPCDPLVDYFLPPPLEAR